jgi:hypothetical protein
MPNVLAGLLIGIGNTSWIAVIGSSAVWGVVWILWSWIQESPWLIGLVHKSMVRKDWGEGKALMVALFIEYVTAFSTALPLASITFLIKGWVT